MYVYIYIYIYIYTHMYIYIYILLFTITIKIPDNYKGGARDVHSVNMASTLENDKGSARLIRQALVTITKVAPG